METDQLKSFVTVAQTLSFSKAAKISYISQPAISHHIECLERQFDVKLFERSTKGVQLTEAGKEFLPYALSMLESMQKVEQQLKRINSGYNKSINISVIPTAKGLLFDCLKIFSKKNPDVFCYINIVNGSEQINAVYNEDCDFSFACFLDSPESEGVSYISARKVGFSLLLPKTMTIPKNLNDLKQFSNTPFISIHPSDGPLLSERIMVICKNRHLVPKITAYYTDASSIIMSVATGMGISILPTQLINENMMEDVHSIPIEEEDAQYKLFISWRNNNTNPSVHLFLDTLKEMFPEKKEYLNYNL